MNPAPLRILFFGTPGFSTTSLNGLLSSNLFEVCGVVTQPDKPAGRGQSLQASPVKKLALEHFLPVFQPHKIKGSEAEFLAAVSVLDEIDFAVVIAFGQILPQAILDYPKFACINIHASLLPRWRGAAPLQRAILAGDIQTGVCIMKMEAGLDTGPVYSVATTEISEIDTTSSLHDRLSEIGAKLLIETLPRIAHESLLPLAQEEKGLCYAEKIKPADLLLDWSQSSKNLSLRIRTFSPKPGAYCLLEGKRLKILKAETATLSSSTNEAGKILGISEQGIVVKTGDGTISLSEIQLEGKKAMLFSEFIKGYPELEGKILQSV